MKRLATILLAATAILVSACGTNQSGSRGTVPTDPPPPASPSTVDPSGPATTAPPGSTGVDTGQPTRTTTVAVWFTRGGKIISTSRTRPATTATSRLALTQFPTVSKVGFQRGGEALGAPLGRADYADLLPAILVSSPLIGQRVSSPITVAGTANVYEATVSVRILDAAGAEIATTFTTATCGSGCRGDYSVAITYRMPREQRATVQVYEVSAENGSRIHVVDIPVTLTA